MRNKLFMLLCIVSVMLSAQSKKPSANAPNKQACKTDSIELADLKEQISLINLPAIDASYQHLKQMKGYDATGNQAKLTELKSLVNKGFGGIDASQPSAVAAAKRAILLKREILLSHPGLDRIILARYKTGENARKMNPSQMGTPPNNWSNQTSARRDKFDAEIIEMGNLKGEPTTRTIFKPTNGSSVPDLRLHWNADRLMFTMNEPGEHHWQVYEVGVDGKNLKQITNGSKEDLDYFDACYLPNGKIAVLSNVGGQGVPCVNGSDQVGNLCLYDPKTQEMRRLTFDQDANWGPVMMHNGKVMYTRWEYTDLTHYFSRFVMHMNPDGTEQKALYGSGSVFPNAIFDMQPLPNHSTRFVGIISGHHGVVRSGRMIIFDPAKNRKEEKGMIQEIPFRNRPIIPLVKDGLVDGVWPQFVKPYPVDNDYFLVSMKHSPTSLWGLYLVDIYDNMTLIAQSEGEGLIHAIPLRKTTIPPAIPDKTKAEEKEATVFIQDIYEGEGLPGVPRGTVKKLRVFTYEYAYLKSPSDHTAQGVQSGWDIKRKLGEVPVEEDGSVIFKVPANTPISVQPLDSEGRAIQWMCSWFTGMPGETVSCVGCHEDQNQVPMPKRVLASTKAPHAMKTPEGGVRSFTFDLEIQPLLDRACVACHNEKSKTDFRGGRRDNDDKKNPKLYSRSYLALHPFVHRQGPEAGMKVLKPYEYFAEVSPLLQLLRNGHHGVKLTDKEWKTLYNWIDFNAPDKGIFENLSEWEGNDQYKRRMQMADKYAGGTAVDWKKELKEYAAYLSNQPKAEPVKPVQKPTTYKEVSVKGFPFTAVASTPEKKVVEVAPGVRVTFVRIPAGKFVMGKNKANTNYAPQHKAEVKKAFWMSETELTNEQVRAFLPNHDSRFYDQQWKDHVNEGYPANNPEQPAIRVSYNEAMEYCRKASGKTGLQITLPTEVQWEWACRAGSETDFWYGSLNSDFSDKENLADKQLNKLAVSGVDPQPVKETSWVYPYYTYHPKEESVDDGAMLPIKCGGYTANAFGLYDMHGNVAEWTRSDYFPYPYKEKLQGTGERKVVRGGSYIDHPKHAIAAARKAFYPWQSVFNVGVRLIIED
ncbi:MAG: SUMF1/EgtB/PvdO family nonheme iron enzyme [Bacteroides sp.]|nr:SUMF1/EgtB/PvdO family nonheme iron enzyme [Bacteroides sp.]